MSNPYEVYKTDTDLETSGVWLVEEAFRVKIARAGGSNEKYAKRYAALTKPHRRAMQLEILAKSIDEDIMRQLFTETIVLDWEVLDKDKSTAENRVYIPRTIHRYPDGEVVSLTQEEVKKVLVNLPELFRYIYAQANDMSLFQGQSKDELEADVKN